MIEYENNKTYQHMDGNRKYLDAFVFVDNYIEAGMLLNSFHYELTELAYYNNLGLSTTNIYFNDWDDTLVGNEEMIILIDIFVNWLKETNQYEQFLKDYLDEQQQKLLETEGSHILLSF